MNELTALCLQSSSPYAFDMSQAYQMAESETDLEVRHELVMEAMRLSALDSAWESDTWMARLKDRCRRVDGSIFLSDRVSS